ncbi:MAG TPA: NAD-dependent epimerase/dehydratase family protein [Pseudomonadales bacterium]|nr:NAD-dependent epimerase/dehydratase family protein [Pseudomonadales bacterium]
MTDGNLVALRGRHVLAIGLGDLGAALAEALLAQGARVTGMRRGVQAPAGVELIRGDAADDDALARLPADVDVAVLCLTPDAYDEAGYRRAYLAPAQAFARRFAGSTLEHVFWVSSTAVYAQGDGLAIDETAAAAPASFRGRVLLEAEAALRSGGVPVTALRLSGIYGPGRTALLRRVLAGRGCAAEPPHFTNRIHRDDAVGALVFLLARALAGARPPAVVIGSDPAPAPRHEVLAWLADRLDVSLEGPDEAGSERAPSRRLLPGVLEALGYRWRYADFRAGFAALISAMEASGELAALRADLEDGDAGSGPLRGA